MDTPTLDVKAPETVVDKPAGDNPTPAPVATGPSAEELRKQNEELNVKLKEKDSQIADLNTTKATIEARLQQTSKTAVEDGNKDIKDRTKRILETAAYDPDAASTELATLLTETTSKASREAVLQAQQAINSQNFVVGLKNGVKQANPELDDDIVDAIMNKADEIAVTNKGKYKTAKEYVDEATKFVKDKFDNYANKKNAIPPLPDGAKAETGSNKPPVTPAADTIPTPAQDIENRKAGMQKKIL